MRQVGDLPAPGSIAPSVPPLIVLVVSPVAKEQLQGHLPVAIYAHVDVSLANNKPADSGL